MQEVIVSCEPLYKTSGDSVIHQDQRTASHTSENERKKTQGDSENQEALNRKLYPQSSTGDTESSECQSKKTELTNDSLSIKVKDEEMEADENKQTGMEDASESQNSECVSMDCTEEKEESRGNKAEGSNLDSEETRAGMTLNSHGVRTNKMHQL